MSDHESVSINLYLYPVRHAPRRANRQTLDQRQALVVILHIGSDFQRAQSLVTTTLRLRTIRGIVATRYQAEFPIGLEMTGKKESSSDRNVTILGRTLLLLGSLGPVGHLPASGSLAVALVGIPLYRLLSVCSPSVYVTIVLVFSLASVCVHQVGDEILGEKDSRKLVLDELAGYMVAVAFLPFTWQIAVVSFLVERALDIIKIPPARQIEQKWPGGWGVVGDDLVAGAYTFVVLHLGVVFFPAWLGIASAS